jgi:hypothetical protein
MKHWVHDYETLINCFIAVFTEYRTDETHTFVIHNLQNDFDALLNFLHQNRTLGEYHISFNGLSFDSQITEYLLTESEYLSQESPDVIAHSIYMKAQETIERSNNGEFSEYSPRDMRINQLDLFKLNHWDNPARRSSLKWIEYSMDWYNVQEMPIHHSHFITTQDEIEIIRNYCINDVRATKQIMNLCKDQITLRKALSAEYGIDLMSASEPRISKELFLHFLSKKLSTSKYELRQLRTIRESIDVKEIILPYIKFKRKEFIGLHEKFMSLVIDPKNTKGAFKHTITHKGVKTVFGFGGVHGATKPGVYEAGNGMIIMTSDVTSFYPNLAIRNKWSPAHIPKEEFCEQYEWFFEERKKIPKKDPRNYVYKIILNSTYGLSNEENSFLYDPEFTMRITMNGQLSLMMLYEMISEAIPESIPLMQNTDGIEMIIPEHKKDIYLTICKLWEDQIQLQLEHDQYQSLVLADCNNYIALFKPKQVSKEEWETLKKKSPHYVFQQEGDKYLFSATKCKGRFEFVDLALHKNKSALIVAKAIYNYFIHDQVPEAFLQRNRNMLDYCIGIKKKGDWFFLESCFAKGKRTDRILQNVVRYYVSNKGCKIIKVNSADGREIQTEAGKWLQTEFNVYQEKPWIEYDIDESYYLTRIYKEIETISGKKEDSQLSLF